MVLHYFFALNFTLLPKFTENLPYFLIGLQMKFSEICFIKHLEGEDTFLFLTKKNILKMLIFYYKTSIWNLKLTIKTMENGNFKHVFLGTMIFHLQTYWKMRQKCYAFKPYKICYRSYDLIKNRIPQSLIVYQKFK